MKAQLNIEFIAGSLLFILALVFVVTQALGVVPQYENLLTTDNRHIEGNALGRFLLSQAGYWENGGSGSDWENHADDVKILGLSTGTASVVNRSKVAALVDNNAADTVNYSEAVTALAVDTRTPGNVTKHDVEFQMQNVTEYAVIEAFNTYNRSNEDSDPAKITEPDEDGGSSAVYTDTSTDHTVHYGRDIVNDVPVQILLVNASTGEDGHIYLSTDNWNFSRVNEHDTATTTVYTFNDANYTAHANQMGVEQSRGTVLVLARELLETPPYGPEPSLTAEQVVNQEHYGNTPDGNIVKLVMEVWRDE